MKKLFLSLIAVGIGTVMSYAQSTLVATLSHEGTITTYYSASALSDAYSAAVDGDLITLSSGTFNAVDIDKRLTIRGAGMEPNSATGTLPTIISGDFYLYKDNVTLEGIYHNSTITCRNNDVTFIKCRFKNIRNYFDSKMKNFNFINCRVAALLKTSLEASITCVNSIINYPENAKKSSSSFIFTNCIVSRGNWGGQEFYRSTMTNCIYIENNVNNPLDASHNLYNTICVYANKNEVNLLANVSNGTSTEVEGFSNVFSTFANFTGEFPDSEKFGLTDNAKATYLGLDGTEVGIYGGAMPFDPTPTGPQITKCNVASKSTADGKLSVDIEVKSN